MAVRSRYPCRLCLREQRCAWLLAELRRVIYTAELRGMPRSEVPEVYVDCEGRFSPRERVVRDNPQGGLAEALGSG